MKFRLMWSNRCARDNYPQITTNTKYLSRILSQLAMWQYLGGKSRGSLSLEALSRFGTLNMILKACFRAICFLIPSEHNYVVRRNARRHVLLLSIHRYGKECEMDCIKLHFLALFPRKYFIMCIAYARKLPSRERVNRRFAASLIE